MKKHLSWTDVVGSFLFAGLLTLVVWRQLDPRGIIVFVSLLIVAELLTHLRWRVGLPCANCGFDPLLYGRRPQAASERVRRVFERRQGQADFLLTANGLIETQRRMQKAYQKRKKALPALELQEKTESTAGKHLSRTI